MNMEFDILYLLRNAQQGIQILIYGLICYYNNILFGLAMESSCKNPLDKSNHLTEIFWSVKNLEQFQQYQNEASCRKSRNDLKEESGKVHNQNFEVEKKCTINNHQYYKDQSKIHINWTQTNSQLSNSDYWPPSKKQIKKQTYREEQIREGQTKVETQTGKNSRKQLKQRIQNAIAFLVIGIKVDKYCFRLKKIERSFINFTEDLQYMAIQKVIDGSNKILKMKQCLGYSVGTKTQRFKDYLKSGYPIKEQTAISMLFPDRSYDFTVACAATRCRLVSQLDFLSSRNNKK